MLFDSVTVPVDLEQSGSEHSSPKTQELFILLQQTFLVKKQIFDSPKAIHQEHIQ